VSKYKLFIWMVIFHISVRTLKDEDKLRQNYILCVYVLLGYISALATVLVFYYVRLVVQFGS
jgi:hypothetical protein